MPNLIMHALHLPSPKDIVASRLNCTLIDVCIDGWTGFMMVRHNGLIKEVVQLKGCAGKNTKFPQGVCHILEPIDTSGHQVTGVCSVFL